MSQDSRVTKPKRQRPKVAKEDRLRAARACLSCQRSKLRCIDSETEKDKCSRCQRRNLSCVYARPDEPGVLDSSYHPERPNEQCSTAPVNVSRTRLISGRGSLVPPAAPVSASVARSEMDAPFSSRMSSTPMQDASQSKTAGAIQNGRILSRIREAMFLDPSVCGPDEDIFSRRHQTGKVAPSNANNALITEAINYLPPKSVADFLCSSCFELGTDSFFYYDQSDLKNSLDDLYNNAQSARRGDCNFVCILLMTLALGSQFVHLKTTDPRSSIQETGHYPGMLFYQLARTLIPDIIASFCLEAVQACFIMSVYLLPAHAYDTSYFYMGLALRMAISLDLHRDKDDLGLPPDKIEARHRLWWSVYSLERTISIKLGRPRTIDINDISTPLPASLPSIDNAQVLDNIHHQIANADLVRLMDYVAQTVPQTFNPQDTAMLDRLEILQQDLKQWKSHLPPHLRLHGLIPRAKGYRTVIHLHQNYANAWIILCRLPLLFLVRERLKRAFVDPNLETFQDVRVDRLAASCIEAAQKMITLFSTLQAQQSLAKFSFTDFQGCSTATIIVLLHSILEAANETARCHGIGSPHVTAGFACLTFMASGGNEEAKVGLRFVQQFQTLAEEAATRVREVSAKSTERTRSPGEETGGEMAAYEDWLREMTSSNGNVLAQSSSWSKAVVRGTTISSERSGDAPPGPSNAPLSSASELSSSSQSASQNFDNEINGRASSVPPDSIEQPSQPTALPPTRDTAAEQPQHYPTSLPDLLPQDLSHFDESFILGLTGLDTLDFADSTYWP